MVMPLYLGVEGMLLHQNDRSKGSRRRFEMTQYGLTFLECVIDGFNCSWLADVECDQTVQIHRPRFLRDTNVRFPGIYVRFTPESGHFRQARQCPLIANNRRSAKANI